MPVSLFIQAQFHPHNSSVFWTASAITDAPELNIDSSEQDRLPDESQFAGDHISRLPWSHEWGKEKGEEESNTCQAAIL